MIDEIEPGQGVLPHLGRDNGLQNIHQGIPYGRRSRRRGPFIVPTADLTAPKGFPDYFVTSHNLAPIGMK